MYEPLYEPIQRTSSSSIQAVIKRFSNFARQDSIETGRFFIYFGSQTGTSEAFAVQLGDECNLRGINVHIIDLAGFSPEKFFRRKNIIFLLSTYGDGLATDNASDFYNFILKFKNDGSNPLSELNFTVCAFGNKSFEKFCNCGIEVDKKMAELGAKRIHRLGLCNAEKDNEEDFSNWKEGLFEALEQVLVGQGTPASGVVTLQPPEDNIVLKKTSEENSSKYGNEITFFDLTPLKVKFCKKMTPADYPVEVFHLNLFLEKKNLNFNLGDVVEILPQNPEDEVVEFFEECGYKKYLNGFFKVVVFDQRKLEVRKNNSFGRPRNLVEFFSKVLDIFGKPTRLFLRKILPFASNTVESNEILEIAENKTENAKALWKEFQELSFTYADIIRNYKSLKIPMEHLLSIIPCIKPRSYSIALSPEIGSCEIAIKINKWENKRIKVCYGTCSKYVLSLREGSVVNVKLSAGTFKFPSSPKVPMIMVGLGTGVSPFRAFIQDRAWQKNNGNEIGPVWLFYGCRHKDKDFLFGEEFSKFKQEGIISQLCPAFSRDQEKKIYVQDKIRENSDKLLEDLVVNGGFLYLCGQAGSVEQDIRNAFYDVIAKGRKSSTEEAKKYFENEIVKKGRYSSELY